MAKIREIEDRDLPGIVTLLSEGFSSKTPGYWERALARLAARPRVDPLPVYGLMLDDGETAQGVMLMISATREQGPVCNLSSWYVRADFRAQAPLLFHRSLRFKGVCFTDCSPAAHVLPIITKFGFRPYSGGSVLIDARTALRGGGRVRSLDPGALQGSQRTHLDYGCQGFLIEGPGGEPEAALYRPTRLKKRIPAARFVSGDPERLFVHAGGLARGLLRRGIPLMLIDCPPGVTPPVGRLLPEYQLRYTKTATPDGPDPAVGDLLDTEVAVFGLM